MALRRTPVAYRRAHSAHRTGGYSFYRRCSKNFNAVFTLRTYNIVTKLISEQIDFGDAAIDFGTGDVELETGDIDWGQIDMLPDAHEATIDFSTTEDAELGIVVQEAGVEGGVAKDNEALSLLDYHKTRNMFIDDLAEVFVNY